MDTVFVPPLLTQRVSLSLGVSLSRRIPIPHMAHHDKVDEALIKEMFDLFDADGGGSIDVEELTHALINLGIADTKDEIDRLVAQIDVDGSGEIEYGEFLEVMTSLMSQRDSAAEMHRAFNYFTEGKERITIGDLRKISIQINDEQSEAFLAEMLTVGDRDADGAVTFADFKSMMETAIANERIGLTDPRTVIRQSNVEDGVRL